MMLRVMMLSVEAAAFEASEAVAAKDFQLSEEDTDKEIQWL